MQINFAISPIFHFSRWLGEFFSFFQSYEISITLSINSLEKPKTFGHFTTVPKYQDSPESCIIPQITPKFERLIHLSPLQSTNNLHEILYHVLGVFH